MEITKRTTNLMLLKALLLLKTIVKLINEVVESLINEFDKLSTMPLINRQF